MKERILACIGFIGAALSYFVGKWDAMLIALCIAMTVDYISGLIVAFVFKNSPKTETGKAETGKASSAVCAVGLVKKLFMLVLVGVANTLDVALGVDFIKAGVIYAFLSNEILSLLENATLMGIPIPKAIQNGLDILNGKVDKENGH